MSAEVTDWDKDKLKEMGRWKRDNDASWKDTAKEFGVEAGKLSSAWYYHYGNKKSYGKKKAKPGGFKRNLPVRQDIQTFEFNPAQPVGQGQKKLAIVLVNYSMAEIFGGGQW